MCFVLQIASGEAISNTTFSSETFKLFYKMISSRVIIMAVVLSFLMLTFSHVADAGCYNTNKVFDIRPKCKTYCANNNGVTAQYHTFSRNNGYVCVCCI